MEISRNIQYQKSVLLKYYRNRASECISEVRHRYSDTEYKKQASALNKLIIETRDKLIKAIEQTANKEVWDSGDVLRCVLMVTYTNYVVMIEARNQVWPYEYMAFTRRIGELWEPFCRLCWDYPRSPHINYFIPPLFTDVRSKLTQEITNFIDTLDISTRQKKELLEYYDKVWNLVNSGEIKLELDLHFEDGINKYVVDFKSGFSSNEKGNTNRLLLVASVYKILDNNYRCLMFIRTEEVRSNHYLQTLKNSGLWTVYCGKETLDQIERYTGFDLSKWLNENVDWKCDLEKEIYRYLKQRKLIHYLEW